MKLFLYLQLGLLLIVSCGSIKTEEELGQQFEKSAFVNYRFLNYDKVVFELNEAEKRIKIQNISYYIRAISNYKLSLFVNALKDLEHFSNIEQEKKDENLFLLALLYGANNNKNSMYNIIKPIIDNYSMDDMYEYKDLLEYIFSNNPDYINDLSFNFKCMSYRILSTEFEKYKNLETSDCKKLLDSLMKY